MQPVALAAAPALSLSTGASATPAVYTQAAHESVVASGKGTVSLVVDLDQLPVQKVDGRSL